MKSYNKNTRMFLWIPPWNISNAAICEIIGEVVLRIDENTLQRSK